VLQQREASVSLVQRHLRLGYARACGLFERMQAEGVVVPVEEENKRWAINGGHCY
jgi:S-DNA-T family DNA segregation ATPase FtsK/SpoIIIE